MRATFAGRGTALVLEPRAIDEWQYAFRRQLDKLGKSFQVFRATVRQGRYDGATLRRLRAERGVGRPVAA